MMFVCYGSLSPSRMSKCRRLILIGGNSVRNGEYDPPQCVCVCVCVRQTLNGYIQLLLLLKWL